MTCHKDNNGGNIRVVKTRLRVEETRPAE